jgi:hypothetical protein
MRAFNKRRRSETFSDDFSALQSGWTGAGFAVSGGNATITPTENTNRIANGDFESWASATDANSWTEQIAGTSTVNREGTNVHGGSFAVRYDKDGSNSQGRVFQSTTIPNNTWHILRYWSRGSDTAPKAQMVGTAIGLNHNSPDRDLTTSYAEHYANGLTSSANPQIFPDSSSGTSKSIYYDDISDYDLTLSSMFATRASSYSNVVTARATITRASSVQRSFKGVVICLDNTSSPTSFIVGFTNGNACFLFELSAGTYTKHIDNSGVTFVDGAPLEVRKNGTTVSLWYNGTQVGTDKTVTATTGTNHGLFAGYGADTFQDFFLQAS